jgi:hypothetical protein
MSVKASGVRTRSRTPQAYTDLYDEQRRTFRVQYPIALVVALGLTGVAAFMITGFLGYGDSLENSVVSGLFHRPWALYLWFCALVLTLQISILRHRSLRPQLTRTLIITILAIIFVAIFDLFNTEILSALQKLLTTVLKIPVTLQNFGKSPWTYTVINFGILAVYWIDTIRRWVRSASGKSPFKPAEIGLDTGESSGAASKQALDAAPPSISELISGDLIAGAFLTVLLYVFFQPGVINHIAQILQPGSSASALSVDTCTLSLPGCVSGAVNNPPTLAFIDLIQTLLYLPLGLIVLALTATIAGLSVPGGVTGVQQRTGLAEQAQGAPGSQGAQGVAGEVGITIFKALQAALTRRVRIAVDNFAVSLRSVIWPLLILIGMFALAAAARSIEQYLHLLSDQHMLGDSTAAKLFSPGDKTTIQKMLDQQHLNIFDPLVALLAGIVAVIAIVLSVALQLFQARVAENTLRFMGLIGFTVLLTFWIFSLALSGFNALFALTQLSNRVPFPQPGATTILSFVALVIAGIALLLRRGRRARRRAPAMPGAGAPSSAAS